MMLAVGFLKIFFIKLRQLPSILSLLRFFPIVSLLYRTIFLKCYSYFISMTFNDLQLYRTSLACHSNFSSSVSCLSMMNPVLRLGCLYTTYMSHHHSHLDSGLLHPFSSVSKLEISFLFLLKSPLVHLLLWNVPISHRLNDLLLYSSWT